MPTLLGFDPRLQVTHEQDVIAALEHALDAHIPGTFNIAGDGQMYLSRILRLGRRIPQPLPGKMYDSAMRGLTRVNITVPAHVQAILKYGRVVDTTLMRSEFGFTPLFTCRQTVLNAYGITGESAP